MKIAVEDLVHAMRQHRDLGHAIWCGMISATLVRAIEKHATSRHNILIEVECGTVISSINLVSWSIPHDTDRPDIQLNFSYEANDKYWDTSGSATIHVPVGLLTDFDQSEFDMWIRERGYAAATRAISKDLKTLRTLVGAYPDKARDQLEARSESGWLVDGAE